MRFLIIILIIPFTTLGQINVSGRVTLCDDFKKGITIKGKLSYTYHRDKKRRILSTEIDTLQTNIYIYRLDSLIRTEKTNYKGQFKLTLPEKDVYRLKFHLMSKVYKDTVINLQSNVDNIKICVSDSGLHNYYLRKIPYDSIKAKKDILNDTVRILTLISKEFSGCRLNYLDYLSQEEKEIIENKFGFRYTYFVFDKIYQNYLDQRQKEYNSVVYRYLDKKLNDNSSRLINKEIFELVQEKKRSGN